jgi:hypothetical protein
MKKFTAISFRRPSFLLSVSVLSLLAGASAHAVVLVADFNDITAGALAGKGGGTGFTGNWSGSAASNVIAPGLSSTLYNVPQSGTSQAVRNANNGGVRQNYRTVTTSPTGEVWFSFLTQTKTSADGVSEESAGISLNVPTTATPFNNRGDFYVQMTGNDLVYSFGAGTAASVNITPRPADTAADKLTLIVGRLVINGGGAADTVSLWVDPDLIANSDINTYTPIYSSSAVNALDTITTLGAIMYQEGSGTLGGGTLDNIRFSDGSGNPMQAYMDVTGVPEPSGLALVLLGATGLIGRRRR